MRWRRLLQGRPACPLFLSGLYRCWTSGVGVRWVVDVFKSFFQRMQRNATRADQTRPDQTRPDQSKERTISLSLARTLENGQARTPVAAFLHTHNYRDKGTQRNVPTVDRSTRTPLPALNLPQNNAASQSEQQPTSESTSHAEDEDSSTTGTRQSRSPQIHPCPTRQN